MQIVMSYVKGNSGYHYRYKDSDLAERYLRCQVDNTLRLGWTPIIATNFPFEWKGIKSHVVDIQSNISAFANKMPMLDWLISNGLVSDDILYQDVDVFNLRYHNFPYEVKDVGMVHHSCIRLRKPQGGVVYFRKSAYDIIHQLAQEIVEKKVKKEESFLPSFYNRPEYKDRFTWLNYTYNMFRQGEFKLKYPLALLPIINCHFHPEDKSCSDCFIEGINAHGVKVITPEVKELIIAHELYKKV